MVRPSLIPLPPIDRRRKIPFLPAILLFTRLTCLTYATNAYAVGPKPDFGVTIGPAILCRDLLDMKFFYDYLSASFGPAYKREQGAYWFRAKAQLFGKDVKEIFVSDQSSDWVFVGAIFNAKPDELAKSVQASAGTDFKKYLSGYQYSPYQSQGTSEIMWQDKDAKLLCRRITGH
jgi:hypothetical protein